MPAGREVSLTVQLPHGSHRSQVLAVEANAVNRLDLLVPFSRPGESAGLFGRVVEAGTGHPVGQARVSLTGETAWALTNDQGFFALEELPTGFQVVEVEHLGYANPRHPVLLEPGTVGQVQVDMAADAVELDGLRVTVRSSWRLRRMRELERRRELGRGAFFDEREIRARGIHYLGDVLRETPGMGARVMGTGVSRRYVIRRVRIGQEYCSPVVFLNGRRYRLPRGLVELSASEMELVEVHRGPAIPAEFETFDGRASSCGVVSAWTKAGD